MSDLKNEHLQNLLQTIEQQEGETFTFNAAKIEEEARFSSDVFTNLPVKILTIFGGFLASFFLLGFIFSAGLYASDIGLILFGIAFLIGSEVLSRRQHELLVSSMSVSFNIIGYLLFSVGFMQLTTNETWLMLALMAIALTFLLVSRETMFIFLAVLVLSGSLINLVLLFKLPDLLHVFIGLNVALYVYMSLYEAKLISGYSRFNKLYRPVRMGLIFPLIVVLAMLSHQDLVTQQIHYVWISGSILLVALLLILRRVMLESHVTDTKVQAVVYSCVVLILLPTIQTPAIAGALLLAISSFYIGHRLSFIVGLLALVLSIVQYYYDLQLTLLQKSGILIVTGCLFLAGLYLLNRYLRSHEK